MVRLSLLRRWLVKACTAASRHLLLWIFSADAVGQGSGSERRYTPSTGKVTERTCTRIHTHAGTGPLHALELVIFLGQKAFLEDRAPGRRGDKCPHLQLDLPSSGQSYVPRNRPGVPDQLPSDRKEVAGMGTALLSGRGSVWAGGG